MDLGNVLKEQSSAAPAPAQGAEPEITQFDEKNKVNIPLILLWASAFISVAGTVLFFMLSSSVHSKVVEIQADIATKDVSITKKKDAANEAEVIAIKAVVAQLKTAQANRFSMVDFLPIFFEHVNKNVTFSTFAVSSDGVISFTGKTDSFRSAAEQVMTLKAWQVDKKDALSGVTLGAVSATRGEDGKITVPVAINATFDKALLPAAIKTHEGSSASGSTTIQFAPVSSGSVTSGTTTGGSNAQVQ